MPRKRSRPDTEKRFQEAVLELVAESGCAELGVNAVAQRAGSDKVLIYRYFGSFDGLLSSVAESREWLPSADETLPLDQFGPEATLKRVFESLQSALSKDSTSLQLLRWRHATSNPLIQRFEKEWNGLWKDITDSLTQTLNRKERVQWELAISLLTLMVQSELLGDPVDLDGLEILSRDLVSVSSHTSTNDSAEEIDAPLPTNLL